MVAGSQMPVFLCGIAFIIHAVCFLKRDIEL
jgi:hypothetical protein